MHTNVIKSNSQPEHNYFFSFLKHFSYIVISRKSFYLYNCVKCLMVVQKCLESIDLSIHHYV